MEIQDDDFKKKNIIEKNKKIKFKKLSKIILQKIIFK